MAKRRLNQVQPEWSVPFEVAQLASGPMTIDLAPDAKTAIEIARRLGVLDLRGFKATITLEHITGSHLIEVQGMVQATVEQTCVNTLQKLETHIRDEFEAWFADLASAVPFAKAKAEIERKTGQSEVEMLDDKEDPDPVIDGKIDLGELAVQYLSLAIDPYPHLPLNEDDGVIEDKTLDENHPFAALAVLKDTKS
jgi:hypothetical protein